VSTGLSAAVGFGIATAVALAATPIAIAVARGTGFLDHPREYRRHGSATPLLGGAVVLLAVLAAVLLLGTSARLLVVLGGAVWLWALGTLDDRFAVAPKWRLLAEAGAGAALFAVGLGWNTALSGVGDLALTIVWVVGVVNAFNLMDNLDGACGTVAAIAAAGIGALAAIRGQAGVAVVAFALAGACCGFLRWNLAGPAKIFLGDGGSMPIGFLVAALAMAASRQASGGNAGILLAALLAGLPLLDATLVSISRTRRRVPLVTGGRDHLTHRIQPALGSARAVAVTLAGAQGLLCILAIGGYELGGTVLAALGLAVFLAGIVAILVLDTARWRPAEIAIGATLGDLKPAIEARAQADAG
jgi:UDP-GlcNAc:undecaprenyl-phosphate/decaprenyl-phosphate GlcNAc-1-phosphate transferase